MGSYRRAVLPGVEEGGQVLEVIQIFRKFKGVDTLLALRQRPSVVRRKTASSCR
jgi:hypothetical protein